MQVLGDHFNRRVIGRQQTAAPRLLCLCFERSLPFDPIEEHCGEEAVPLVVEHLRSIGIQELGLAAVREEMTAAAQRIAEGGASSSIDHIRRHDAEVERHGHLEKHLELIHLRTVLGSREVKLNEAIDGLLAGPLPDAQMRRLAAERTNPAGLETHAIKPAVLRPRLSKPVGRERLLDITGVEEITQRPLDAKAIQHFLLGLPAVVTQFGSGLADLASLT